MKKAMELPWRSRGAGAFAIMLAVCSALLSSCGEEARQPLRIASSPWPGYEPIYLAREIGYLTPDKATVFELPSSDITLESFRNRSADMATLTLDETLELLQGGVKLRILTVLDISNGADAVMASPKVKSLKDLKGKRIAILNIPLGVYMLSRLLDAAKLTRADVTVIPMAENRHEEMYRQGKADVFITFDPFKSQLAALGAHDIFNSSNIPNEIFDLMLVHEDVYMQRREEVCNVARQWFRTLEYMRQSPDAAERLISKRLMTTAQEYRNMTNGIKTPLLQENLVLIDAGSAAILKPAQLLNAAMLREGQMKKTVDVRAALDPALGACIRD